jgi:kynurenine formamidase
MSKIKFLSHSISEESPTYGNKNAAQIEALSSISEGDTANSSKWTFQTNHIGTHIDFPKHFCNEGKSLSDYPADFWIFNRIGYLKSDLDSFEKNIQNLPIDLEILLWESGFGKFRGEEIYWSQQLVIPSHFADLIRKRFPYLRAFGFDMISLTSQLNKTEGKKAHTKFLCEHQIIVIEDMKLNLTNHMLKQLIISPWQIEDADGAPCTILGVL